MNLTKEFIEGQRQRARETWVAETSNGVIVVAHPGTQPPDDPKVLKQQFGLGPGDEVIRLIDSSEAPPLAAMERELASQSRKATAEKS